MLLKNLNAIDERQALQTTQKSIGEAVAEARAAEAQKQTQRWEREKEKLIAEAEAAAKARVESDLLIQQRRIGLERWKQELQREQEIEKTVAAAGVVSANEATVEHAVDDDNKNLPSTDAMMEQHPILGTMVADFGYKRVYVTTAAALASIPVWEKQRIYRHDRAKTMAADKLKTPHLGLPGVISLHEVSATPTFIHDVKKEPVFIFFLLSYLSTLVLLECRWESQYIGWTTPRWHVDHLERKS